MTHKRTRCKQPSLLFARWSALGKIKKEAREKRNNNITSSKKERKEGVDDTEIDRIRKSVPNKGGVISRREEEGKW